MSALGHKQTFAVQNGMSALPPKADMCSATRYVRFVPIADIRKRVFPIKKGSPAAAISGQNLPGPNTSLSALVQKRTFGSSHVDAP